jgi:hypothetical protein
MLSDILIAVGFAAIGFILGVYAACATVLTKYKKYPIDAILLIDQYAQKW